MIFFIRLFFDCFFQLFPFTLLCFYPFDNCYRMAKKKTIFTTVLLLIVLSAFFAVSGLLIAARTSNALFRFQMINVVFFLFIIPYFAWYLYAIKAIWQQKFFVFFFVLTCAAILYSVINCIISYIESYVLADFRDDTISYSTAYLYWVFTLISLPIILLIIKKFYLPIRDELDKKEIGYLFFLSIPLFILLSCGISFIDINYLITNPITLFLFATLLVALIVIYIVVFRMLYLSHARALLEQEKMQAQHQMELRNEQYHRITETIQASRKLRHDIKHHIFAIQGFLAAGDIKKAEKYLNEYLDIVNQYSVMNLCSNLIVNMVVSHYYALAKENEIDFTVRINVPKELPIQESDISVLLGNLLENSITAASSVLGDKRKIQLNMMVSGKALVIAVDNGFDGKVVYENGEYISTKPDHRGFGLKSIASIAKKYNGEAEFTHEDMVFHSSVILEFAEDD